MAGGGRSGLTGVEVSPDLLLRAYRAGIFPMAEHRDSPELFWVEPRRRGILPLDGFHLSRSLARRLRRADYHTTLNSDFAGVVAGCADRAETWISPQIHDLYLALHERGYAHSLEIWMQGALVGGVYGVCVGRAFCGESMFSRQRDASKIALAWLVDLLRRAGFTLFDTQFLTEHLASLGAVDISRAQYSALLKQALECEVNILSVPLARSGQEVVQRITQTS